MLPLIPIIGAGAVGSLVVVSVTAGVKKLAHWDREAEICRWLRCTGIGDDYFPNLRNHEGIPILTLAIMTNQEFKLIRALVLDGADPNQRTPMGETALTVALKQNMSLKVIQLLLDHGADVNALDNLGNTPLFYVRNTFVLRKIVDAGAILDARNIDGQTALNCVSNKKVFNELAKLGADLDLDNTDGSRAVFMGEDSGDDDDDEIARARAELTVCRIPGGYHDHGLDELLLDAVQSGDIRSVCMLLNDHADPNAFALRDKTGMIADFVTAINLAIENDHPAILDVLCRAGGDVNRIVGRALLPMKTAMKNDRSRCVRILMTYGAKLDSELKWCALRSQAYATIRVLFVMGAYDGWDAALIRAALKNRAFLRYLLLQHVTFNKTHLCETIMNNDLDCLELFFEFGAKAESVLLNTAITFSRNEVIDMLFRKGLVPDVDNMKRAIELGRVEYLERFLSMGVDVTPEVVRFAQCKYNLSHSIFDRSEECLALVKEHLKKDEARTNP